MKTHSESLRSRALVLLFALAVFWLARPATASPVTFCLEGEVCSVCGDGVCDLDEFCPEDCQPSYSFCGNEICDGNETCSACPGDCGTCPGDDPGEGGGEPPHNTEEHSDAALEALRASSCARSLNITPKEAEQWMNAADCLNNACTGNADLTAPARSAQLKEATWNSICWACRNPDHFTSNTFPGWFGRGQDTGFSVGWTPRDSQQAQSALMTQAISMAQSADTDEQRKAALKVAFQACHYATDRTACGHGLGNVFCDPTGATVSSACRSFISSNSGLLTWQDQLILAGATTTCSGGTVLAGESWLAGAGWVGRSCGDVLRVAGWQPSEGLALAAQERFIRHHGIGQQLSDGTHNTCAPDIVESGIPGCNSGECLPDHNFEPEGHAADTAVVAQACIALLDQTCGVMKRPKVAHKICDRSGPLGLGQVKIGECRDAVKLPNAPSYGEQTYINCIEALAAASQEADPPGCFNSPGGDTGGPIGFGGPNDCHACRDNNQQCGYAVCPNGGIQSCESCISPLVCNSYGWCDNPGGSTAQACVNVDCGWDRTGGGLPICCDEGCPGSCPTYGNGPDGGGGGGGGTGGGSGGDGGCDAAGYWSDGGCWDSAICTGKSVFLRDGTECFE